MRMRPRTQGEPQIESEATGADHGYVPPQNRVGMSDAAFGDGSARAANAPQTQPLSVQPPKRKKQIWELEAETDAGRDDAATDAMMARAKAAAGPLVLQNPLAAIEPMSAEKTMADAPFAAPVSPQDRAKTRILGFHSPETEKDVFAQAGARSNRAGQFPAGWLVVVEGPGRGAAFVVSPSVSSIGRGEDQAICLDFGDTSISRNNHAAVAYDAEQNKFFIGHGNKSNIVRRNNQPLLATEELMNDDVIRIGKTTLMFKALCGEGFHWGGDDDAHTNGSGDD